jgi:hypothetical protein
MTPWQLTHAYDINDQGWIVGNAFNTITGCCSPDSAWLPPRYAAPLK